MFPGLSISHSKIMKMFIKLGFGQSTVYLPLHYWTIKLLGKDNFKIIYNEKIYNLLPRIWVDENAK